MNRFKVHENDWTRMNGVHFARARLASRRGADGERASEEGNRDEGGDGGKIELPFFARALSVRPSVRLFSVLSLSFSGNAQERKLDYGNEAEKKFAGERRTEEEEEERGRAKREGGLWGLGRRCTARPRSDSGRRLAAPASRGHSHTGLG